MSKRRGYTRELEVCAALKKDDYITFRSPRSLGPADVIALRPGSRLGIQVKSNVAGPFGHFGPKDRAALLTFCDMADIRPWLIWWPPYGRMTWIAPAQWPKAASNEIAKESFS